MVGKSSGICFATRWYTGLLLGVYQDPRWLAWNVLGNTSDWELHVYCMWYIWIVWFWRKPYSEKPAPVTWPEHPKLFADDQNSWSW